MGWNGMDSEAWANKSARPRGLSGAVPDHALSKVEPRVGLWKLSTANNGAAEGGVGGVVTLSYRADRVGDTNPQGKGNYKTRKGY